MVVCPVIMRITLDAEVIRDLEELTGKNLSKNGNELIVELIEMAEAGQNLTLHAGWNQVALIKMRMKIHEETFLYPYG